MSDTFTKINIAFIPPPQLAKSVISISQQLAKRYHTGFILSNRGPYPHITLYEMIIENQGLSQVVKTLSDIISDQKPLLLKSDTYQAIEGYLVLLLVRTESLRFLHQQVISRLSPMNLGKYYQKPQTNTGNWEIQKANIVQYGHPLVDELYFPHITITRFIDWSVTGRLVSELKIPHSRISISQLGVFLSGENGTCTKLIHEFRLAKRRSSK